MRRTLLVWAGCCALGLATASAKAQSFCRYEITAVIEGPSCGILGPALVDLLSINDLGQACGFYRHCATFDKRPFAWSEETGIVILPLPEGATVGEAVDINCVLGADGLGQVLCTLDFPALAGQRACLYDDGAWTVLPPAQGGIHSSGAAINSNTQVAGTRSTPSATAFHWENGVFVDIPSTIGGASSANGMNESGVVVGQMGFSTPQHAYVWEGLTLVDLGTVLGGPSARARDVNEAEWIVGSANVFERKPDVHSEAFLIDGKNTIAIGLPSTFHRSAATSVNDAGQILVHAIRVEPFFVTVIHLWQHGEMVPVADLVEPMPGIYFGPESPIAINNNGQIGAVAATDEFTNVGIILTPIDRPLGDVNFDCAVDDHDLTSVLRDWGPCPAVGSCICDIVTSETFQPPGDGVVDGADLAVVLGNWTDTVGASAANRRR